MNQAELKDYLLKRQSTRRAYAGCHPMSVAYNLPGKGWNAPAQDGSRWVESLEGAGLRFVNYADKIVRLNHTGWYCDSFESDTYRGCVLMMQGKGGKNRYLAAYEDPYNPGTYCVDMRAGIFEGYGADYYPSNRNHDDGAHDAARAADSFAQKRAEEAREYDEAWQNGQRYAGHVAAIKEAKETSSNLIREIKEAGRKFSPAICATLRGKLASLRRTITTERKKRDELKAVSGWWKRKYGSAFNDGAGETVFNVGG